MLDQREPSDHLVEHDVVFLVAHALDQSEEALDRREIRTDQGPGVGDQHHPLGRGQLAHRGEQPRQRRVVVGGPVEPARVGVADAPGNGAARRERDPGLGVPQQHRLLLHAVGVAVTQHHRHEPSGLSPARNPRLRPRLGEEAPLLEAYAAAVRLEREVDHRVSGLTNPAVRQVDDRLSRRLVQRAPQIVGGGVRLAMAAHVEADAGAKLVRAQEALDHAEDRAALFVGDGVEGLARLLGVVHLGRGSGEPRSARRAPAPSPCPPRSPSRCATRGASRRRSCKPSRSRTPR